MISEPEENPRYLGDEYVFTEPDPQLVELAALLGDVNTALEWTRTHEWGVFDDWLAREIQVATVDALEAQDLSVLAQKRGEIHAFRRIREFPANLRSQQIRSLEAAAELMGPQEENP